MKNTENYSDTKQSGTIISPSVLRLSGFYSYGSYGTETNSKSLSSYITFESDPRTHFTLGYNNLWLSNNNVGGKYFSQDVYSARSSFWISQRINSIINASYLYEGKIEYVADAESFVLGGINMNYWLGYTTSIGAGISAVYHESNFEVFTYQGLIVQHIGNGAWTSLSVAMSKANWTNHLYFVRGNLSIPLQDWCTIHTSAGYGKRVFFHDENLLVVYNERDPQSLIVTLGAAVNVFPSLQLLPTYEYNEFEKSTIRYITMGVKLIY